MCQQCRVIKRNGLYYPIDPKGRVIHDGYHSGELAYIKAQMYPSLGDARKDGNCPVLCLENGYIFPNVVEAGAAINKTPAQLRKAIREEYACGGYHWQFVSGEAV